MRKHIDFELFIKGILNTWSKMGKSLVTPKEIRSVDENDHPKL